MITPAHSAAPYLERSVGSVLTQTYDDWEMVIVDDASADDTYDVAAALAANHPHRIKVLQLEHNSGPAVARNVAVGASGGALLALLDADDSWRPDYLERQVALLDAARSDGRNVGIAACNATIVDFDGTEQDTFADRFGWVDELTYDRLIEYPYIFVSALLTREAFDAVGGFSPDCWGSEDYDLWLRIVEAGFEVVMTREPLARYHLLRDSLSRNELRMADAGIAAYGRALGRPFSSEAQRKVLRHQLRHYRALRQRALVAEAVRQRRLAVGAGRAFRALPYGVVAFLQSPGRWQEWLDELIGRRRRRPPTTTAGE